MKKNIWFIWTAAFNTPRITKIAEELDKKNYNITIVYWDRGFKNQGIADNIEKFRSRFNIISIKTGVTPYGRGVYTIKNRIIYGLKLHALIKRNFNKIDMLYVCDLDSGLPLLRFFNKKERMKSFFDIADFIETFKSPLPAILREFLKKSYQYIFKKADFIVLPDKNRLINIPKKFQKKVKIISNAPNIQVEKLTDYELPIDKERINIIYYGGFSAERGIEFLLDSGKELKEFINLYFVGWGQLETLVKITAEKYENIHFIGKLSQSEALSVLKKMDLSYIVYDPKFEHNKLASPNKMFEAFLLSKPIIVARGTSIDKIVENEKCGFVVDYNYNSIYNLLRNLSKEMLIKPSINSGNTYSLYSWEKSKNTIHELFI